MKRTILLLVLFIRFCSLQSQSADAVLNSLATDRQKADTLFALALKKFYTNKFDSADALFNIGLPFAVKTGDNDLISNYYLTLGNAGNLGGKPEKGLAYVKKAFPYLARTPTYDYHMKYFVIQAMIFGQLHQNDSAFYYYHQAELLNDRENPYKNWLVYCGIAQLFQEAENFPESEKYFTKAYAITKAKGIRIDHGTILYRFANFYYDSGNPEKFAALVDEQQKFVAAGKRDISNDPPLHRLIFNDWKKKPFDKKVAFMETVKQELLKEGNISNAALANVYLAEFYEEENLSEKALPYILENEKLIDKKNEPINLYTNTKMLYRLMKKTGHSNDATDQADRLFALKDSLIKMQQRETMADLEKKYETERQEKDIALLNASNKLNSLHLAKEIAVKKNLLLENKLKDSAFGSEKAYNALLAKENALKKTQLQTQLAFKAAISRENTSRGKELVKEKKARWQLSAAAILLLLSGAVIYLLYRKQRMKNKLIQQQSEELKVLMKEIHHRVKNNLQIISSLLDIQSISLAGNNPAAQAIREGRNRVQSMAIIHQFLYQENNLRGIWMEDYIKNLSENLFASYNINPGAIKLETDIDRLSLDIDTVIPLGLILNELVSNSLKYAFGDIGKGILQISLKEKEDTLQLLVKDNGKGFPPGNNRLERKSFGLQLIAAFAKKLKASLTMYNDNGAVVAMQIKKYKLA